MSIRLITHKIAVTAAAGVIALSAAGCAVEVPMSAFRLAPPDAAKAIETAPQQPLHDQRQPSVR